MFKSNNNDNNNIPGKTANSTEKRCILKNQTIINN